MIVPIVDVRAEYRSIKSEIDAAVAHVLETGQFVLGEEVEALEQEFAALCGVSHGVGVNSGTSALHLALLASGVGPGDDVITVPVTFVATVAAICYTGARPVLVDVDPRSLTMDVRAIEAAITPRTKAILPVHLYGQPADMDPILAIARRHGLVVIEDAAQAHASRYFDRPVGSLGHMGCFSFYPSKNLGACGEGGMIVTSDGDTAARLRLLRNWGQESRYAHVIPGFNYRLQGIQAAVLRVKLRRLEAWTEQRRRHAAHYRELLQGADLVLPAEMPYARHVYHLFTVRSAARDHLASVLGEAGIQTGKHYPVPVHLQPAYAVLGHAAGAFPVSERAATEVLSLPMFPQLTEEQVAVVAGALRRALVPAT